ncbi:MAG TPA: prepilin-type N-terminal cleavage/methylation domain-containing protein [Methylomirabilota bacterium]|jgi:general secretion pathway protein J|nr:prepilin-type N-terminal cleavage/methylation domain-containing protein [Methylomirabilota bacterium]
MRRGERGFTLIELVLALSIVAVMLTMLFGGLRVGLRAWQRGEERAGTLEHARSMSYLLEQAFGGAYAYQGQTDQNSRPKILFKGEAEKVSFVTVSAPLPLPTALAFTAVTFSMESGVSPGLAIREKAVPNFDPFEEVVPLVVDPTITAVRFRYLRDADSGSWEDTWDAAEERAMPRAVEITLTAIINGRVQEQPAILIPVRVTTP